MKQYQILSFIEKVNNQVHRFDAIRINNQYTGDYACPTCPGDIRVETDFICIPNSYINSVRCPLRNISFAKGEQSSIGAIREIKLKRGRAVLRGTSQADFVELGLVSLYVIPQPVLMTQTKIKMPKSTINPVKKSAEAPSRSQISIEDSFSTIEKKILETIPELRLAKFLKKNLPSTLKEFLINFFTKYNNEIETIFTSDKKVQTEPGKRRSLGDIFRICKYYYPTCALQDVLKLLFVDLHAHFKIGFRTSYCHRIHKRVWYYSAGSRNLTEDNNKDEYGHRVDFYKSKL
jgi:hypothetical protein